MELLMNPCEASSMPGVSSPCRISHVPRQSMRPLASCSSISGTALMYIEAVVMFTRAFMACAKAFSHCAKKWRSAPSDLMVSRFFMPVMVTFCSRASVTSWLMAIFFCLVVVVRITMTSIRMENTSTSPSFQLKRMTK